MPKIDKAAIGCTGIVGGGALVVSMLSTEAPMACLPKGAVFDNVARSVVIAFEAVGELDLSSPVPLAKYGTVFQNIFSSFNVGWSLGGEDAWDPIITGWKKEGGGEGGRVARRCCWRQVRTALEARRRSTTSRSASARLSFFSNSRRCHLDLEIRL